MEFRLTMKKRKPISHNFRNTDGLTLFLDRDGVINTRLVDDYVKQTSDFRFTEGFLPGLASIAVYFSTIVVVTNQQGVGKGLMTEAELQGIHDFMVGQVTLAGARIDKVYYCPDLKNSGSLNRKPEVGMALQARRDFPGIDFKKAWMVGDLLTDMEFGRRMRMTTVFIDDGGTAPLPDSLVDYRFDSFARFAKWVCS